MSDKIQDGDGRHTENHIIFDHNVASIALFAPNLIQTLKTGPTARFTVKIYIVQKSKMTAAAVLKSVKRP